MTSYQRTFARLAGEPVDRLPAQPIFMLYAAKIIGRTYEDYVRDYRVAVAGQLAIVEQFGMDMVSLCSDPWREAGDCGTELTYFDAQPPAARAHLLADKSALAHLPMPDPRRGERMSDRIAGAALFREQVGGQVPILGWIEGPVAEAADLRGINEIMLDLIEDEPFVRDLFEFCTQMEIAFALAQIEAGCDIIGIGDAAASLISLETYEQLALPYEQRMVQAIQAAGARVRLHICGDTNHLLPRMADTGAEIIELDHMVDLRAAREYFGPEVVIMGNMDPVRVMERSSPDIVWRDCARCHQEAGERYILAAGCEIPPDTPRENIQALFDYARSTT